MGTEDDITNWGLSKKKNKSAMNQQRGFTLLEMMLVLALVAITASVVLFTYGREDAASTRARETAARFTAALELAIDRATLSGQPVGIHFSDSAWRIMVPGKTPSARRWVPLQEDAADESKMTGVKNSQFNFSHLNLMTATNRRW